MSPSVACQPTLLPGHASLPPHLPIHRPVPAAGGAVRVAVDGAALGLLGPWHHAPAAGQHQGEGAGGHVNNGTQDELLGFELWVASHQYQEVGIL